MLNAINNIYFSCKLLKLINIASWKLFHFCINDKTFFQLFNCLSFRSFYRMILLTILLWGSFHVSQKNQIKNVFQICGVALQRIAFERAVLHHREALQDLDQSREEVDLSHARAAGKTYHIISSLSWKQIRGKLF